MVIALITAGGKGTRLKSDIPKQFLEINDKPLLIYTLEKFQQNCRIDAIIISCLSGWEEQLKKKIKEYRISKVKWIVKNGDSQVESINNCLNLLKKKGNKNDIIVIHAGNRPLVSEELINKSIDECILNDNAIAAISCPEVLVSKKDYKVYERKEFYRVQTPQTLKLNKLIKIYNELNNKELNDVATTCDLMIRTGEKVNFIDGSHMNIKITYPEDMKIFEAVIKNLK